MAEKSTDLRCDFCKEVNSIFFFFNFWKNQYQKKSLLQNEIILSAEVKLSLPWEKVHWAFWAEQSLNIAQ